MRDKALSLIEREGLLAHGERVIVALSGGADSVSLLHFLISIKELYQLQLYAAHLNHMIRGEEAQRDEDFVRKLCEEYGVELFIRRVDIPALSKERGESEELVGRVERYRFFEELSEKYHAKVATAHTKSDNTETVLFNIIRGAGLSGLCGIREKRDDIIRPLLLCTREEIERYCEEHRLSFVTDSTNADLYYSRNRLRLSVLPELRALNPSVDESVSRLCRIARDTDAYLSKISLEELNNCRTTCGYSCEKLLSLDKAVRGYAIKAILDEAGASYDYRHLELIGRELSAHGALDLRDGYTVSCSQGILRVLPLKEEITDELCVRLSAYEGAELIDGEEYKRREKINKKFLNNCIPCDIITDSTVVRYRREKDMFTLPDRNVTKSVKKLMNELKIPKELRDRLRLVANGSEVLWIEGIGISKDIKEHGTASKAYYLMK